MKNERSPIRDAGSMMMPLLYAFIAACASLSLLKNNFFLGTDACLYAISGRNLVDLGSYPLTYASPFYPLLIAGAYGVTGQLQWSAHLISVISFAFSVFLFFRLVGDHYRKRTAHMATVLYVSHGLVLGYSYRGLTHAVDLLLFIGYLHLSFALLKDKLLRLPRIAILGAVLAAAVLNRPEHMVTAILLVPALIRLADAQRRKKILMLVVLLGVMGTLLYPYAHFLKETTGRWGLTLKTANLRNIEEVDSSGQAGGRRYVDRGFYDFDLGRYVWGHKKQLFRKYVNGLGRACVQLSEILYFGLGLILAGWGWLVPRRSARSGPQDIILFLCLAPLLFVIPFSDLQPRYYITYLPIFFLWIARGIESVADRFAEGHPHPQTGRIRIYALILGFLLLANIAYTISHHTLTIQAVPIEHVEMGTWMKREIPDVKNALMVSVKPFVAFYADSHYTSPPAVQDHADLIRWMRSESVDYLIADARDGISSQPPFKVLRNERHDHPGLKPVHVIYKSRKIILYQLRPLKSISF